MIRRNLINFFLSFFIGCFLLFSNLSWADKLSGYSITNEEELNVVVKSLAKYNEDLREQRQLQQEQLSAIASEHSNVSLQITHVQNALKTLHEQEEWLSFSTALGETLRLQLLRLPTKPKVQGWDAEIASVRVNQLNYNEALSELDNYSALTEPLSKTKNGITYRSLIRQQKELLQSLISGSDTLILELTRLNIANKQLINALDNINDAAHRYFFWVADINPISRHYLANLVTDLSQLVFSTDTLSELIGAGVQILSTPSTFILLFLALVFVAVNFRFKSRYYEFLERNAARVGKVTQDSYAITLRVVAFSLLMALSLPVLWAVIGYSLKMAWSYPIASALGYGVNAAAPILWVFMISARFAEPNGLFISHLGWSESQVRSAMKYYQLSVWVVIPLVMLVMSFNVYDNHRYAATIGRICFILLCFALIFMTNAIRRAGVPLYIDKKGSGDNLFSRALWFILLCAPWLAIIAASVGYLSTAQALLGRLEASVIIWFGLLVIYFMVRRWMLIQKRRIEFERAKQRRQEKLAQRAKLVDEELTHSHAEASSSNFSTASNSSNDANDDIVEVDLDVISSQSLQLVRSIMVMIALICMVLLWSELHSAFAFMENIKLWGTTTSINGVDVDQNITLASAFIAILVMTITIQLVKNLPALLELGLLQHLDLAPGTGYAISTVSKYIILLIGCMVAFSFIGIDWSKIQWLIAALGVGLGFGLQEIFANFISGLIILFEKPIRIGDTVTIRELTGNVAKINTRATTIVDWDRKEIVMPNKAFITEQLINWSLSDSITRIVLTVPASIDIDSQKIIDILNQAAKDCSYVLNEPEPSAFLVDIQEGIQLFELRVFCSEMGHRLPLRNEINQLIIAAYKHQDLKLPFPPLQTNLEALGRKSARRTYKIGTL